ncbi:TPA: DUF1108 family protein [Staphylococcus pseudintermedius]|uniref:DUF1108 family protein n=1 Tax=Staphylococcus pseudintermedius TaxID=283734 RepID=UPI0011213CAE|nr:DUF1108 family protein [Staphylococcus pseudintermedius]EJO7112430.1 DUF1108 family protein [Staphylococcus pseudintermedius]MBM0395710.1 DUF1108 family protein [Staphylococcus pseudintermedius]MCE5604756.1 DUF1108 family protein [Staphylococcus pseudintermedius]MCE5607244.1 DUF1108 family protein [Staphylococcus pseudintermedius]MCE5609484.1 DUF1108 family protein [Staphylococcus pseudintermedius]
MYFPNGEEFSGIIEVEGFKFRKHVTKEENHVLIEITDMTYKIVAETKVSDISDVDIAQEVISAALYDYIENETDDLDKIMAQLIKN